MDRDEIIAQLRSIAAAFDAGVPDERDERTQGRIEGFMAALRAVGLGFGVDDWRRDDAHNQHP